MGDVTDYVIRSIQKAITQIQRNCDYRPPDLLDKYIESHKGWKRDENCGQPGENGKNLEDHSYWFQCGAPEGDVLSYRFGWNGSSSKIEDIDPGWGPWMSSEDVTKGLSEVQIKVAKGKPSSGESKYWTTVSCRYKELDKFLPPHVQSKSEKW